MHRMTVELGPDQAQAIEVIANASGHTKADVIRFSLALMQLFVREGRRGNGVGVIKGERVVKEIAGIWDVKEPALA